jgi:hypothetical protein
MNVDAMRTWTRWTQLRFISKRMVFLQNCRRAAGDLHTVTCRATERPPMPQFLWCARAPLAVVAPSGRFSVAEAGNATRAEVPPTRAAPSRLLVG